MPYAYRIGGLSVSVLVLTTSLALILLPESAPAAGSQPESQCAQVPLLAAAQSDHALDGELEILSWNIQKASNAGWEVDLANLGGQADLAFIQEASPQAGISRFIPRSLHRAFARGYTTEAMETGVMTLAAGLPNMHCNLTAMEPWLGTPKATSVASYPLKDRDDRLLTINLHAVNFALGVTEFREQFAALRNLLSDHQGPIILAGDLNTWSMKRQSLVDTFMSEHGLQAVSFEPDLRTTVFGRALDHIYVRGMQALSAEVIPVSTSDHNPLRVRLGLQ